MVKQYLTIWVLMEDTKYDTLGIDQRGFPIFLDGSIALGGLEWEARNSGGKIRIDFHHSPYLQGMLNDYDQFAIWVERIEAIEESYIEETYLLKYRKNGGWQRSTFQPVSHFLHHLRRISHRSSAISLNGFFQRTRILGIDNEVFLPINGQRLESQFLFSYQMAPDRFINFFRLFRLFQR